MKTTEKISSEERYNIARKEAADLAMVFDTMAKIAHFDSEEEVILSILQLLEILFIPEILHYTTIKNSIPGRIFSLSTAKEDKNILEKRSNIFEGKYLWSSSQKGFQVKVQYRNTDFGIIGVDNVKFPEHKKHYLNVTLTIADVCGLALENARRFQKIKNNEKVLFNEKKKLEEAFATVKTLSGLLPICSHCKKIRDDQGYWKQIEHYLQEHSEAEFSHSICQECAITLYPDLDLYPD